MHDSHMHLANLCEHPHVIPTLAAWHHEQWAHLNPGDSADARAQRMMQYREDQLPLAIVAMDEQKQPMGSASLIACDMHTHAELTPWLASVFVHETRRRRGVGRTLVNAVCDRARQLGYDRIHLFTPDRESFYEMLGWTTMYVEPFLGIQATVMYRDLDDSTPGTQGTYHKAACE